MRKSILVIVTFLLLVAFTGFIASSIGWYQINTNSSTTATSASSFTHKKYYEGVYLTGSRIQSTDIAGGFDSQLYDSKYQFNESDLTYSLNDFVLHSGDIVCVKRFVATGNKSAMTYTSYNSTESTKYSQYYHVNSTTGAITIQRSGYYTFNIAANNEVTLKVAYYLQFDSGDDMTGLMNDNSFALTSTAATGTNERVSRTTDNTGIDGLYKLDAVIDTGNEHVDTNLRYIYFANTASWSEVYVHYWFNAQNKQGTTFPGFKMEKTNVIAPSNAGAYLYRVYIPIDVNGFLFTDGNGSQTGNYTSGENFNRFTSTTGVYYYTANNDSNQYKNSYVANDECATISDGGVRDSLISDYFTYTSKNKSGSGDDEYIYSGFMGKYATNSNIINQLYSAFNDALQANPNNPIINVDISYYQVNALYIVGEINGVNAWGTPLEKFKVNSNGEKTLSLTAGDKIKLRMFRAGSNTSYGTNKVSPADYHPGGLWLPSAGYWTGLWDTTGQTYKWFLMDNKAREAATFENENDDKSNLVIQHSGTFTFSIDTRFGWGSINVTYLSDKVFIEKASGDNDGYLEWKDDTTEVDIPYLTYNATNYHYSYLSGESLANALKVVNEHSSDYVFAGWYNAATNGTELSAAQLTTMFESYKTQNATASIYDGSGNLLVAPAQFAYGYVHHIGTYIMGTVQGTNHGWTTSGIDSGFKLDNGSMADGSSVVIYLNAGDTIRIRDFAYASSSDTRDGKGWFDLTNTFTNNVDAYGNGTSNGNYVVNTGKAGYYRITLGSNDSTKHRTFTVDRVYLATFTSSILTSSFTTAPKESYYYDTSVSNANTNPTRTSIIDDNNTAEVTSDDKYTKFFYKASGDTNDIPTLNTTNFKFFVTISGVKIIDDKTNFRKNNDLVCEPFIASQSGTFIIGDYTGAKTYSTLDGGQMSITPDTDYSYTISSDQNSTKAGKWFSNDNIRIATGIGAPGLIQVVYLPAESTIRVMDYQLNRYYWWGDIQDGSVSFSENDGDGTISTSGYYKFITRQGNDTNYYVDVQRYYMVETKDDFTQSGNSSTFYTGATTVKYLVKSGTDITNSHYNGIHASVIRKFNGWYSTYNTEYVKPTYYLNFNNLSKTTTINSENTNNGSITLYSNYTVADFEIYLVDNGVYTKVTTTVGNTVVDKMIDSTSILGGTDQYNYYQVSMPIQQVSKDAYFVIKRVYGGNQTDEFLTFAVSGAGDANNRNNLQASTVAASAGNGNPKGAYAYTKGQFKYSTAPLVGSSTSIVLGQFDFLKGYGAVVHLKASRNVNNPGFEVWVESTYRYYFSLSTEWRTNMTSTTISATHISSNTPVSLTFNSSGVITGRSNPAPINDLNFYFSGTSGYVDLNNEYTNLTISRNPSYNLTNTIYLQLGHADGWSTNVYEFGTQTTTKTVLYAKSSSVPYCYTWGGSGNGNYPGQQMTKLNGTTDTYYYIVENNDTDFKMSSINGSSDTGDQVIETRNGYCLINSNWSSISKSINIENASFPGESMTFDRNGNNTDIFRFEYDSDLYDYLIVSYQRDGYNGGNRIQSSDLVIGSLTNNTYIEGGTWTNTSHATKFDKSNDDLYAYSTCSVILDFNYEIDLMPLRTVRFYAIDGETIMETRQIPEGALVGALPVISADDGYEYNWYSASSGGDLYTSLNIIGISNIDLFARREAISYSIALDINQGNGTSIPDIEHHTANVTYDSSEVEIDEISRTGYTFGGWYTDSDWNNGTKIIDENGNLVENVTISSVQYTDTDGKWKYTNNLTLYAKWTPNEYTITINDGVGDSYTTKVAYDSNVISFTPRSRDYYSLEYYYLTGDSTNSIVANNGRQFIAGDGTYVNGSGYWTHDGDISITAFWEPIPYTLSTSPSSNTHVAKIEWLNSENSVITSANYATEGLKIRITAETGYHFGNSNSTTTYTFDSISLLDSTDAFTITDSGNAHTATYAFTTPTISINEYTVTISSNNTDYGKVNSSSSMITINNVEYNSNIDISTTTLTLTNTDYVAAATTNTNAYHYAFTSWNINDDTKVTSDLYITATFTCTPQTYTVSFNGNGSTSGSMSTPMSITYGEAEQTITTNAYSRNGYTFNGWNTDANGGGTAFAYNDTISNLEANMTLYAQWTRKEVTVTLTRNNSTYGSLTEDSFNVPYGTEYVSDNSTITFKNNVGADYFTTNKVITATPSTQNDQFTYGLGDWSSSSGTLNASATITKTFTCTLRTYTVTITSNDTGLGTVDVSSVTSVGYGSTIAVSSNTITVKETTITATQHADGSDYTYAFVGWNVSNGATVTGDTNVVATFSRTGCTYSVSFNSNGGSGDAMADMSITYGAVAQTLSTNTYTRNGYYFTGWKTASSSGTSYAYNAQISNLQDDLVLYAQWAPYSLTITYDKNNGGGTAPSGPGAIKFDGSDISDQEFADSTYMTAPTNKDFVGWSVVSSATAATYVAGQEFTAEIIQNLYNDSYATDANSDGNKDITLYAVWIVKVTVSFAGNGADGGSMTSQLVANGVTTAIKANGFTRTGYTFNGWEKTSGTGTVSGEVNSQTINATTDVTLTAQWTPITYDITYHLNGGSGASNSTYTIETATITLPAAGSLTAPTGYTFAGWYGNAELSGDAITTIPSGSHGNKDFYAKWTRAITLSENHSDNNNTSPWTLETDSITVTYNTSGVPSITAPTRTGYTFAGWYSAPSDGTLVINTSGVLQNTTITDIISSGKWTTSSTNITLYAQWTRNIYNVIYYDQGASDAIAFTGSTQTTSYTYGVGLTLGSPTRSGYVFGGWFTTYSGSTSVSNISTTDTGTKTFYAKWYKIVSAPTANNSTFTYTGNSQTYSLTTNSGYTITNNTRTAAGSQTVTVSLKSGYCWSGSTAGSIDLANKSYTFTINNANITGTLACSSIEWTGSAIRPTTSNLSGLTSVNSQAITYTFSSTQDGTYTSNMPSNTNPGRYTVYYKASAANHNQKTGSFTYDIDAIYYLSIANVSSWWTSNSAKQAICVYNSSDANNYRYWYQLTSTGTSNLYKATVPGNIAASITNIIYVRLSNNTINYGQTNSSANWSYKWNQTKDMSDAQNHVGGTYYVLNYYTSTDSSKQNVGGWDNNNFLYLNTTNWERDDAASIGAYVWNDSGNHWYNMEYVYDSNNNPICYTQIATGYTKVIFARMSSSTDLDFNHIYNQTGDINDLFSHYNGTYYIDGYSYGHWA